MAVGRDNISFYAETAEALTAWSDPNWMLLFIDVDKDSGTGWCGYDLVVNKSVKSGSRTSVMKYNARSGKWQAVGTASFSTAENKLEICIPRKVLFNSGLLFFMKSSNTASMTGFNIQQRIKVGFYIQSVQPRAGFLAGQSISLSNKK